MVAFALVLFFFSLSCIVTLFCLKAWEARRGHVIAPGLRQKADRGSLGFKSMLATHRSDLSKLSPAASRFAWYVIHEFVLWFAAFARAAERQSHKIANLVSQKYRFQRRETQSEFLNEVSVVALVDDSATMQIAQEATAVESLSLSEPITEPIARHTTAPSAKMRVASKSRRTAPRKRVRRDPDQSTQDVGAS